MEILFESDNSKKNCKLPESKRGRIFQISELIKFLTTIRSQRLTTLWSKYVFIMSFWRINNNRVYGIDLFIFILNML